mgnify:CR=1 FL=1|jgi:hypothetical protein
MRRILVMAVISVLFLPFVSTDGNADGPLGWVQSAGGFEDEFVSGHVVLDDQSIVVAGSFVTSAFFEDGAIEATGLSGDTDMFVAKTNESGNWTSFFAFGSTGTDGIDSIALHTSGDIILAGHFCLGTAGESCGMEFTGSSFSMNKSSNEGEGDAFVGRFSYTEDVLTPIWVRTVSNNNDLSVFDISINPNGGIAVGVFHKGLVEVEEFILFGSEGTSLAIINYDENGNPTWASGISSSDSIEPFGGLCHADNGYLHITGTYVGSIEFEERYFSSGEADIFAAQLDGDGNFTWTAFAGGTGEDWANDCAIDSFGEMHIIGQIEFTADFGFINATSNGWRDLFHATLNANGVWTEVSNSGGGGWENLHSIVIDSRDNKIVTGTYTSGFMLGLDQLTDRDSNGDKRDVFIAQMDSSNQWEWAVSAGGSGDDVSFSIELGDNDTPIAVLGFQNTIALGNFSLTSTGGNDIGVWYYARDQDSDGLTDGSDNCPRIANPDQQDSDSDLAGDECDDDDDGDGIGDDWDDCTPGEIGWTSAPNTDFDADGCRDISEDFDDDEDGIMDLYDECEKGSVGWISTLENDENQDGCEDVDTDGDGFVDQLDKCPGLSDDQSDLDGDGIGDACDDDTDGDGIVDNFDNCPTDSFDWTSVHETDHDQDGCRDEDRDADDDGDNILDLSDDCPTGEINWNTLEPGSSDHDNDGCNDIEEDLDDDNDGFEDTIDSCPLGYVGPSGVGMDLDQDGCIDSSEDLDDDNDGVNDTLDDCRYTPVGMEVDSNGCSGVQLDDDDDGVHNLNDLCPSTPVGERVSSTGCVLETQEEGKGIDDSESSSSLTWVFFTIAGVLVVIALVVTFRPQPPLPPMPAGKKVVPISTVDDGGGQGGSGTTSAEVVDSSLDVNTVEPEVTADESGSASEDSALVE